jgi:hypothetical protein
MSGVTFIIQGHRVDELSGYVLRLQSNPNYSAWEQAIVSRGINTIVVTDNIRDVPAAKQAEFSNILYGDNPSDAVSTSKTGPTAYIALSQGEALTADGSPKDQYVTFGHEFYHIVNPVQGNDDPHPPSFREDVNKYFGFEQPYEMSFPNGKPVESNHLWVTRSAIRKPARRRSGHRRSE